MNEEPTTSLAGHNPNDPTLRLLTTLEQLGERKLERKRKAAERLLRENGVTHDIFNPDGVTRPWTFDPVPLVISGQDWSNIEAGLVQRAEIFEHLLKDIYGPQLVLKDGVLPPDVVLSHKNFLWPCWQQQRPETRQMNLYSADIARGANGQYWVLADHAFPPLGSGYALENRIVMSRSFPELFHGVKVHRLAFYFRALKNLLHRLSPRQDEEPNIVILTSGPEYPHFFEHSYLAAYLGFPLVQGADLSVRDGHVWLKTVAGLQRIDVILSRLDDALCDPLELNGDSLLGVAGLLEVARRGNVATTNMIGANAIENPGLMPFLPSLAEYFLGEELKLPSQPTWWCGQERERDHVLANLDKLVVRPIHPLPGIAESRPGQLDGTELETLKEEILRRPHLFIGQQELELLPVPTFNEQRLDQRPCLLSSYLIANGESYVALSGGLARVSQNGGPTLPTPTNCCTKDLWILTDERDKQVTLWRQTTTDQFIQPRIGALPSRAAENLFWAGRYVERAEATARLLRAILVKYDESKGSEDPDEQRSLRNFLQALTRVTATYPGFIGTEGKTKLRDPKAELMSLARDAGRSGTLNSSLRQLARCAYLVRDMLPVDAWRIIDDIQANWKPRFSHHLVGSGRLYNSINRLLLQLSAFSGLLNDNMAREPDWLMLKMGRSLERGLNLISLFEETLVPRYRPAMEAQMCESVLATCNSLIIYRRRYRSFMQLPSLIELLVTDENYPRALAYQLLQLERMTREIPLGSQNAQERDDLELLQRLSAEIAALEPKKLIRFAEGDENYYPLLRSFLNSQKAGLECLSDIFTQRYFSPSKPQHRLGGLVRDKAS
ncbi:MAG: hypothetical protein C0622_00500 [Desulfuromonas sp.]|nr:MAG: hypothetical protein C0622_00500 [Desulfuromonas sp.]